jgi:hypothetical protein
MGKAKKPLTLHLRAEGKTEVEKLLATVALGLAVGVREGKISPGDASGLFYVTAMLRFQGSREVDERLIEALHAGSELDDVSRLSPNGMGRALNEIRERALMVLGALPPSSEPFARKWIDRT